MTRAKVGDRAQFVEALLEDFKTERRFETIVFSHVLEHVENASAALAKLANC
jgi:2-polyprenyl-3-methyl-5-hydroxy-6-metoxy-1,4-benzoquinol methylase